MISYLNLFGVSFLAGSFVPLGSEILFLYLVGTGLSKFWLLLIATLGNTLGGISCYLIGKWGGPILIQKFLRIPSSKIKKWRNKITGKGEWVCFFCWLPFVGEAIASTAGLFSLNLYKITGYMFLGKLIRYSLFLIPSFLSKG